MKIQLTKLETIQARTDLDSRSAQILADRLTKLERMVLTVLFQSAADNGHDFGFIEDARKSVKTPKQLGGVVASLVKKELIEVYSPVTTDSGTYTQFTWNTDLDTIRNLCEREPTL